MSRMGDKMDFSQQMALHTAMSEGVRLKNQGFQAMEKGKYEKAIENFQQGLELMEAGFGHNTSPITPYLVGMSEAYIKLKDWVNAEKPAKKLLKMARKNKDNDDIKTATELLSEIEISRNGGKIAETPVQDENIDPASGDPLCLSCKKVTAEFRCSSCKLANYCSRECQRADWPKHKSSCYTNTVKASKDSAIASSSGATGGALKPRCGLCGFEGSRSIKIGKTECCGNWICQDMETYELMSYRLNSCHRNHDRYTMCGFHYHEKHKGKFADCMACTTARDCTHGSSSGEVAWKKFCNKHFYFENVGEKEMKRNRELKKDGTKAMLHQIKFN